MNFYKFSVFLLMGVFFNIQNCWSMKDVKEDEGSLPIKKTSPEDPIQEESTFKNNLIIIPKDIHNQLETQTQKQTLHMSFLLFQPIWQEKPVKETPELYENLYTKEIKNLKKNPITKNKKNATTIFEGEETQLENFSKLSHESKRKRELFEMMQEKAANQMVPLNQEEIIKHRKENSSIKFSYNYRERSMLKDIIRMSSSCMMMSFYSMKNFTHGDPLCKFIDGGLFSLSPTLQIYDGRRLKPRRGSGGSGGGAGLQIQNLDGTSEN
jgi:hypothetical protein